jgi:hypothetical protein
MTVQRHDYKNKPKSTNVSYPTFIPFDTTSTNEDPPVETKQKVITKMVKEKARQNTRDQKVKLSKSKSNTQTYSIHSEDIDIKRPSTTSRLDTNDNVTFNTLIKPTRSLDKISHSYTKLCTNIVPLSNPSFHFAKQFESIHHYSKYRYQHSSYISDNEEQIIEIDTENCPLEDIITHRFIEQI